MLDVISERSSLTSRPGTEDSFSRKFGFSERHRSPSPTDYYRNQFKIQTHLWERVKDLNEFIHNGIMKFLDKQAVRDLIHAYDADDIFTHGEEHFYENLFDDNFIIDQTNGTDDGARNKFSLFLDVFIKNQEVKTNQSKNEKVKDKAKTKRKKGGRGNGGPHAQVYYSGSIFNVISQIMVQLFRVWTQTNNRVHNHERRDSELIDAIMENQQKEKFHLYV